MIMLQAVDIHKTYEQAGNKLHVLKGIHLGIKEGDVLSIVGPSGAGKSTLLHILGVLERPTQGRVILEGDDVYHLSDEKRSVLRNRKIGFIFQFYHLLAEFTALENVMLPALIQGQSPGSATLEAKALDLLNRVGLTQRVSHKPYQLSGGEQQRVAIARSLINNPGIIFCDEPTGNLDSETGKEIIELLMSLNEIHRQTLVIVTHDEEIARRSHRIMHMRDGRLV
jgi:lipoprotein-releasing system ATP-binding protein